MRRAAAIIGLLLSGAYVCLHLVLASGPVQRRVLKEVKEALSNYGVAFEMESIEFSGIFPKLYLNRVKINAKEGSTLELPEPLSIDKVRISFLPVPLLYRKIVIDELILFNPRIFLPKADRIYARAESFLKSQSKAELTPPQGGFSVEFRRFAVVDAWIDLTVVNPDLVVKSNSVSAAVELGGGKQRSFSISSQSLGVWYDKTDFSLQELDVNLDWTPSSLRVNNGIVRIGDTRLDLKGTMSLPFSQDSLPRNLRVSYEVSSDTAILKRLPAPRFHHYRGKIQSSGQIQLENKLWSGQGDLSYDRLSYKGYEIGTGSAGFALKKDVLELTNLKLLYGAGTFEGPKASIRLDQDMKIEGALRYSGLRLESVLRAVRVTRPGVNLVSNGNIQVAGFLKPDFSITATMDSQYQNLMVAEDLDRGFLPDNALIQFGAGVLKGPLKFTQERMTFDAQASVLGGAAHATGYVGFDDDTTKVRLEAKQASLTQLERIGKLRLGGVAKLIAEVEVSDNDPRIVGTFDVEEASISGVSLGKVKGEAYYQTSLLTFENLEVPSIQPIRGNGYVDFKDSQVKYKFFVDGARADINQVLRVFDKRDLGFRKPSGGETSVRVTLEGGETSDFELVATGQARDFEWYDEKWRSATFSIGYKDGDTELRRVLLHKSVGGLEIRGKFKQSKNSLEFLSHGLGVHSLDTFAGSPIKGELMGRLKIEGDKKEFFKNASGELRLLRTTFRDQPIADSTVRIAEAEKGIELLLQVGGESLRARFLKAHSARESELMVFFREYDFAPALTIWMGKDLLQLNSLRASGNLTLTGAFDEWASLKGKAALQTLEVGFKGKPMQAEKTIAVTLDRGELKVAPFSVVGQDSQVALELNYIPANNFEASLDGKLDLQFLQPFLPGLDYGSGDISLRLRVSGHPDRFQMLGNINVKDGVFRITGLSDEFRSTQAQLTVSQDKIAIDKLESNLNGGSVHVTGDIRIDRLNALAPNLQIEADKVSLRMEDYLRGRLSGTFALVGDKKPYSFAGQCQVHEGFLTSFNMKARAATAATSAPVMKWDIKCAAPSRLFVATEIMEAEFKGDLNLVGNSHSPGLLGAVESTRGSLLFRDTKFALDSANVRFEDRNEIVPRFRVSGLAQVTELRSADAQTARELREYQIGLQVSGIPSDYKLRLTSTPPLLEQEIISLLVLGVTKQQTDSGGYLDLGTALVGQIPLQSKIQSELGVGVKIRSQNQAALQPQASATTNSSLTANATVPTVEIQKDLTKSTRVSYSNSLDTSIPISEFKIQQMLDDNVSVNASTRRSQVGTTPTDSRAYGVDVRYRFQFE
jgi:translocation and assembly module TamB